MNDIKFDYSRLKWAMLKAGLTQEALAKKAGISISSLNLKLQNKRYFSQADITAIEKALDLKKIDAQFDNTPYSLDKYFFAI